VAWVTNAQRGFQGSLSADVDNGWGSMTGPVEYGRRQGLPASLGLVVWQK